MAMISLRIGEAHYAGSDTWYLYRYVEKQDAALAALKQENERLVKWVDDLQSGMYINCVYCGHRYGPKDKVPCTMANALKQHIEQCPKHPMSALKKSLAAAEKRERELRELLREIDEYYVLEAEHYERIGRLLGGERGCDD